REEVACQRLVLVQRREVEVEAYVGQRLIQIRGPVSAGAQVAQQGVAKISAHIERKTILEVRLERLGFPAGDGERDRLDASQEVGEARGALEPRSDRCALFCR